MKILVDEHLPRALVGFLRERGHDTLNLRDLGLRGAADRNVFAAAQKEGAALVTADLDFADIRRYPPGSHCGIIVLMALDAQPVCTPGASLAVSYRASGAIRPTVRGLHPRTVNAHLHCSVPLR